MSDLLELAERVRRKLANLIVGDRTVLFVTKAQAEQMGAMNYLAIDDATLGLIFRRNWAIVSKHFANQANDEGRSFRSTMTTGCVLFLASEAARANAESADFKVTGSLDGGRSEGRWGVHVERLPDDYESDAPLVERAADGRITRLEVTEANPGYRQWLLDRRVEREARARAAGGDSDG